MAYYVAKYNGYIADNPNIDFERCDGQVFHYYEVSTASMSNTANSMTVTGGQSNYPLAYIDTDRTMEFTFTSAQFDLELFEMANASTITTGDYGTRETELFNVVSADSALKVTIPYECKAGSVKIRGLTEANAADTGKFTVTITAAAAATAGSTVVTFNSGDVAAGDTVVVSYIRRIVSASRMSVKTESTTAKGALYAHWPVYSSGDDCSDAAVKGWLHLYIPRVRVTALPGFDNSLTQQAA